MSSVRPLHAATPLSDGDNLEGITEEQGKQEEEQANLTCTHCGKEIAGAPYKLTLLRSFTLWGHTIPEQVVYFCSKECEEEFVEGCLDTSIIDN